MLESSEESFESFSVLRSFKANSCRIFGRAEIIWYCVLEWNGNGIKQTKLSYKGVLSVVSKVVRSRSNQKIRKICVVRPSKIVMQISSDVIGLKKSLSQAHKYQRGLNRLFKPCPKVTKVSSIAIELKSSRGTSN